MLKMARNSKEYPISKNLKWSEEEYTLKELIEKITSLPNFLKVTESFYLSSERSLDLDDVYHLHGRREQLVYNALPVINNVISTEKAFIPLNYKDKVNLLPLEGLPWMYNGIQEVAMECPLYFKVTQKPEGKMPQNVKIKENDILKFCHVNYRDADRMKIKSLACCVVKSTTNITEREKKALIEIPVELGGTFECLPDPTEYTLMEIEEIQESYPGKKRVKFTDQTSYKPEENFHGEFILEKTECRSEVICTPVEMRPTCLIDDLSSVQLFTVDAEMDAKFSVCKMKELDMLKIDCKTLKPIINFKPQEISHYMGNDYDYIKLSEVIKKSENSSVAVLQKDGDYVDMAEVEETIYDDAVSERKDQKRLPDQSYTREGKSPKAPPVPTVKPLRQTQSLKIKSPRPIPRFNKSQSVDSDPRGGPTERCTPDGARGGIETFEDVPEDVTPLTIQELCKVFELYGLGEVAKKCSELKIDGSTLMSLDKEDLKKEPFNFTGFNLIRIMMMKDKKKPK